jgi:hypothetical protein
MGTELILVHIVFIASCVFFSYKSGEHSGRQKMLQDLLDSEVLTIERLEALYGSVLDK